MIPCYDRRVRTALCMQYGLRLLFEKHMNGNVTDIDWRQKE